MKIRLLGGDDHDAVIAASPLFDGPADPDATRRFLADPGHHVFIAYDGATPVGFVTGVETTHPDKGTEMFLYELSVAESHRRRGIGTKLVTSLRELAEERGCYGMFVLTDDDNAAACATYAVAGAPPPTTHVMFTWEFRTPDAT